jgi:hypothetical protein
MVLAEWTFVDMLWTMIVFFAWVMWFWLVIATFADIFRRNDISGWWKAFWTIIIFIIPLIGVLIYLIARPKMTEQDRQLMQEYEARQQRAAGYSAADEITKLNNLKASGAITEEEFQAMKAKAMA